MSTETLVHKWNLGETYTNNQYMAYIRKTVSWKWVLGFPDQAARRINDLEKQNAALRELASRMATEMREVDHEFASLRDYDAARKEAQP